MRMSTEVFLDATCHFPFKQNSCNCVECRSSMIAIHDDLVPLHPYCVGLINSVIITVNNVSSYGNYFSCLQLWWSGSLLV